MCWYFRDRTKEMIRSIFFSLIFLAAFRLIEPVRGTCSNSFSTGNSSDLCFYSDNEMRSWLDAFHHCSSRTLDGSLIEIFTLEQFEQLKTINIETPIGFWLGANNFLVSSSSSNSQWHWLNGSPVNSQMIRWCSNDTHETAIGAQCAAFDPRGQCVTNFLCQTLLPAPCVARSTFFINSFKAKSNTGRVSTGLCLSTLSDGYGNWWTYTVLLLNWFLLFCFFLYLCNRLLLDKNTLLLSAILALLSFIMILVFAILWGVQYQDIIQIPLAIVILGSLASVVLLLILLIILSKRNLVQRSKTCVISLIVVLVIEAFLMLGLILCTAYCSGYISLASTSIDKDIIASLLASLITAITILCYTFLLTLLDNGTPDRVEPMKAAPARTVPAAIAPPPSSVVRHSQTNIARPTPVPPGKRYETIERATSPVDERVLEEFYGDQPKDMHSYSLGGRRYVVYEGKHHTEDIESYRKDLVQAMLLQEPDGLRQAIDRSKASIHTIALRDDINQAEALVAKLT